MGAISKSKGKHLHNREEVKKLNRKALIIGGVAAGGILILMVISFLTA
jgi:hypothetical protein